MPIDPNFQPRRALAPKLKRRIGWNEVRALEKCEQTRNDGRIEGCGRFSHRRKRSIMGLMTVGPEARGSFTLNDVPTHFVTFCPHCSTGLRVRSVYKGQAVRCKRCNDKFWAAEADGPHTTNSNGGGAVLLAQGPRFRKEALIVVACPECAATLRVRHSHVGHRVACKRCAHVFIGSWPTESPQDPAHAWPPATTTPPGVFPLQSQSNHVESDTRLKALQSQSDRLSAENQQLKIRKQQLKADVARLQSRARPALGWRTSGLTPESSN